MRCKITALLLLAVLTVTLGQEVITPNDSENRCDDTEASDTCVACSDLSSPFVQIAFDKCCSNSKAFQFCDACLSDPESCGKLANELEELADLESDDDYYDDGSDEAENDDDYYDEVMQNLFESVSNADTGIDGSRSKRFGRLFMKTPKRYGRLLFGKRGSGMGLQKRFGRLYLGSGSYFGKRSENDVEKRYGSLFMNKNRWFGKRSPDKRYGPLFIGKSRNGWFGKRSGDDDESNDVMKRYGPLYIGTGGYYGKRSEPIVANKRYGRLFMGRRRGSWLG